MQWKFSAHPSGAEPEQAASEAKRLTPPATSAPPRAHASRVKSATARGDIDSVFHDGVYSCFWVAERCRQKGGG